MEDTVTFGTSGCREKREFFTDNRVQRIGAGILNHLSESADKGKIIVGYDTRKRSKRIAKNLGYVLSNDFEVLLTDRPTPTPALALYCKEHPDVVFGISATASHNPTGYNGIKLIREDGTDAHEDITDEIEDMIPSDVTDTSSVELREVQAVDYYVDNLLRKFQQTSLEGLNVVYDAVNGAGSGVLEKLLRNLGANVRTVRSNSDVGLDGVEPNPTIVSKDRIMSMMDWGDIGFISDGDADRVKVVTNNRRTVNSSELLALIYENLLEEYQKGDAVRAVGAGSMIDSVANHDGYSVYESKIGFKNIGRKVSEKNAVFGGDSTDGYCYANHLLNKDGLYTAVLVSIAHSHSPVQNRVKSLRNRYGRRYTGSVNYPILLRYYIRCISFVEDGASFTRVQASCFNDDTCRD